MKKRIKTKLFAVLAAVLTVAIALCGCGGNTGGNDTPAPDNNEKAKTLVSIAEDSEWLAAEVATVSQSGTGTIIAADDDGVTIATCYHLTGYDAAHVEFRFYGETAFVGGAGAVELVGYSEQFDLAVFKVKKPGFRRGKVENADGLQKKGTEVIALGNAYGLGISAFEGVTSLSETVEKEENYLKPMIRVTAAGNPGNSGAPIMTADGKLLGLVLGKRNDGEAMTYVLPIAIVTALYENALGGTENGKIAYSAVKFTADEITENNVTEKQITVTVGTGDKAAKIKYADGEFIKTSATGNVKIDKVNGNDCPNNLIDFTAKLVEKSAVTLTADGKTYEFS